MDLFGTFYGENGPLLAGGALVDTIRFISAIVTALCGLPASGCLSPSGTLWLLFDGVYADPTTSPFLDAAYVQTQMLAMQ